MRHGKQRASSEFRWASGSLILVGCILLSGRAVDAGVASRVRGAPPNQATPALTVTAAPTASATGTGTATASATGTGTATASATGTVTATASATGTGATTAEPNTPGHPTASTPTQAATPAPNLLPYVSRSHVIYTPTPTLTPTVTPTASRTPKPWIAQVFVGNNTSSEMCYEVYGTGIGRRCFPPGEHLYGRFQAGVYLFRVELRCGSAELPWQYDGGRFVHDFWCPAPPG